MGIFKLKTVLLGLSSVLAATSLVAADAVVDDEFAENQNEFGYYWYYYDDNTGVGKNDRPQAAPTSTPSVIDVKYTDSTRQAFGDASDTYKIKSYTFTPGSEEGNGYASMPFTMGSTWKASYGTAQPFVGIGTMIADNGKTIDLTGATSVKFKIRSHTGDLTVRFKIQTKEIDEISEVKGSLLKGDEFGYYGAPVTVSTSWNDVEVKVTDLELPGTWAREIPFNIKSATKLAWEVQKEANPTAEKDTLDIDEVTIVGYTFVDPTFWYKEASKTIPSGAEFATFDKAPYNETPMKMYWYAYNDSEIEGNSEVTAGAVKDEETKRLSLEVTEGSGSEGQGALLEYQLGKAVMQGANSVQGFIGLGVNVYDSAKVRYWDAKAANAKSIYFHYVTDGDAKMVTLEISDKNDVGDADNPTRKDSRGSGIVYYINLPATEGVWKAVDIPFESLVYHEGWSGSKFIAFDQTALAKIQWKVQGKEGLSGKFAVDNVYFPGASLPVKVGKIAAKTSPFHVSYLNGNVNINWNNNVAFTNGKISLVNFRGAVVSSASIAKSSKVAASFSAKTLPSGMYFVNFSGIDASGKSVAKQASISIVR